MFYVIVYYRTTVQPHSSSFKGRFKGASEGEAVEAAIKNLEDLFREKSIDPDAVMTLTKVEVFPI